MKMLSKYSSQQFTLDFVLAKENSYDLALENVIMVSNRTFNM